MRTAAVELQEPLAPMVRPISGKAPLDPMVADKLLDLLSTDNAFRRLFRKDPMAALIEAGYQFPVNNQANTIQFLPRLKCLATGKLASKKEIAASRELIRLFVTSSGYLTTPHCLEAGKVKSTLGCKR